MHDFTAHPLFERQMALEAEMVSRGSDVFRKRLADAKADNLESTTPHGSHLLRSAIKPVADGIRAFLAAVNTGKAGRKHVAARYLVQVEPEVAAFLCLRTCLNFISSRVTLQNAAITVADALETEVRLAHFEQQNLDEYRKARKRAERSSNERHRRTVYTYIAGKNDVALPSWPKRAKVLVGHKLIEMLADITGYIEIVTERNASSSSKGKSGYTYHVIGTGKCLDWMQHMQAHAELATPEYLPTVMPPRPWINPYEGGYYSVFKSIHLVKNGPAPYMEELSMLADQMPILYEAVNAMQATGYSINTKVLDVMRQLWETGGDVAGLPVRESYSLPRCPVCGAEISPSQSRGVGNKHACFTLPEAEDALKAWKQEAAIIYEKNIVTLSRRFAFAKTLWLAERFKDEATGLRAFPGPIRWRPIRPRSRRRRHPHRQPTSGGLAHAGRCENIHLRLPVRRWPGAAWRVAGSRRHGRTEAEGRTDDEETVPHQNPGHQETHGSHQQGAGRAALPERRGWPPPACALQAQRTQSHLPVRWCAAGQAGHGALALEAGGQRLAARR